MKKRIKKDIYDKCFLFRLGNKDTSGTYNLSG